MDCNECYVELAAPNEGVSGWIVFCKLHAAAEQMRDALGAIICRACDNRIGYTGAPTNHYGDWTKCATCKVARAALLAAKGE